MVQTEAQIKTTESSLLGSSLCTQPRSVSFSQDGDFHSENNFSSSHSVAGGTSHQKGTNFLSVALVPRGGASSNYEKLPFSYENDNQITRSTDTASHNPIASLNKQTIVSTAELSKHMSTSSHTPMKTSPGQVALECERFPLVLTQPHKWGSSSRNEITSNTKRNPVSVLDEVLKKILPDSFKALQGNSTQLSGTRNPTESSSFQLSPPCTFPSVPLPSTNIKGSEWFIGNIPLPPHKLRSPTSPLNTDYDDSLEKEMSLNQRNGTDEPKSSNEDSKSGMDLGKAYHVTTTGETRRILAVENFGKFNYEGFADTAGFNTEIQPKVAFSATSGNHLREPERLKSERNSWRLTENACRLTINGEKGTTSNMATKRKPFSKDTPSSDAEGQPSVLPSVSSVTNCKESETFEANNQTGKMLGNSSLVITAREKSLSLYEGTPFTDSEVQSKVASTVNPKRLTTQSNQLDGREQCISVTSTCSTVVSQATSTRDQTVGFLDGISMLAKAAGLGKKTSNQVVFPVHSTTKQIYSSDRIAPKERAKENKSDLKQQSDNNTIFIKNSASLQTTPITSRTFTWQSHSNLSTADSLISVSEKTSTHRENYSLAGFANGTSTNKIAPPFAVHTNALTVDDGEAEKKFLEISEFKGKEQSIFTSQTMSCNNASGHQNVSHHSRFGTVSRNRHQAMPQYHTSPREERFLTLARSYKDQEGTERKTRQTSVPNIVITKPRYDPYPFTRPKGKEAHLHSVWSNTHSVPKMHARRCPAPHRKLTQEVPRNSDAQFSQHLCSQFPERMHIEGMRNKNECIKQPCLSLFEPEAAHARLNSTSLNLLQPLPSEQRPPHTYRFFTTTNYEVNQDLSTSQTTKRATSPSKNPETSKRGFLLHSQTHNQDAKTTTKESGTHNSTVSSSKPSSTAESNHDCQTPKQFLNSPSSQTDCRRKPQFEISQYCQLYLDQIRKSKEAQIDTTGTFSDSEHRSHQNSTPHSERETTDGNRGLQNNVQVTFQSCSVQRQRERCNDQPKLRPRVQKQKGKHYLLQHPNPRRVIFQHRKFTSSPQRQQKYLPDELSRPALCELRSEAKQMP